MMGEGEDGVGIMMVLGQGCQLANGGVGTKVALKYGWLRQG